jgi:hypothetical protein
MDEPNFQLTNINKRKIHVWISSFLHSVAGSGIIPAGQNGVAVPGAISRATSALYNLIVPLAGAPAYSKYTVQVKQFALDKNLTAAGANRDVENQLNQTVAAGAICIDGLPLALMGTPQFNTTAVEAGVPAVPVPPHPQQLPQSQSEVAFGKIMAVFDVDPTGNGAPALANDPSNPKVVVERNILGENQIRIEIRDAINMEYCYGGIFAAGAAALPDWTMCLEIEGLDGFEEFPVARRGAQPNPTNGMGTGNQAGFHDTGRKASHRSVGY